MQKDEIRKRRNVIREGLGRDSLPDATGQAFLGSPRLDTQQVFSRRHRNMHDTLGQAAARPFDSARFIHEKEPDLFRTVEQRRLRPGEGAPGGQRALWYSIGIRWQLCGSSHHYRISSLEQRDLNDTRQERGSVCGYVRTSRTFLLRNPDP